MIGFPVCPECGGSGEVQHDPGWSAQGGAIMDTCPSCDGEGVIITDELRKLVANRFWDAVQGEQSEAWCFEAADELLAAMVRHLKSQDTPSRERLGDT